MTTTTRDVEAYREARTGLQDVLSSLTSQQRVLGAQVSATAPVRVLQQAKRVDDALLATNEAIGALTEALEAEGER